mgnify:CR=1 FL=1
MKNYYGKFEEIKRLSLANLIDKLSLISNIEYSAKEDSSSDYQKSIKKAKTINPKIENLGDLNKYYYSLKEEIEKREKVYLAGSKLIELINKEIPYFLEKLENKF